MESIQTILMTKDEARTLIEEIKGNITKIGEKLLDLHDREGWRALGYESWRECTQAEFQYSQSRVYQLLGHARVVRQIADSTMVESIPTSERQTRELSKLEPDQQALAWKQTYQETGKDQPTAGEVKKVVERDYTPAPKPGAKPKKKSSSPTYSSGGDYSQPDPGIDSDFDGDQDPGPSREELLNTIENLVYVAGEPDMGCYKDYSWAMARVSEAEDILRRAGREVN